MTDHRWADPVERDYGVTGRAKPASFDIHKKRPQSARPSESSQRGSTHDNKYAVAAGESLMANFTQLQVEKISADSHIKKLEKEIHDQRLMLETLTKENEDQKSIIRQLSHKKGKHDGRHETEVSWQREDDSPEMRRIKQVMDQLNKEVEGLEMKYARKVEQLEKQVLVQPYETDVSEYEMQLKQYKEKLTEAKEECNTLKIKARDVIQDLNSKKEELEMTVRQLKQENSDLSDRLSQEMNVKVSSDESSMENISISSRPMKIADSYNLFCTTEWLEIKTALDDNQDRYKRVKESEVYDCLCNILLVAHTKAVEFQQIVTERVLKVLQNPLDSYQARGREPKMLKSPQQLSNAVGDFLRVSSESADLSKLEQDIGDYIRQKYYNIHSICRYGNANIGMERYIKGAAGLAWKMVNQRPVMRYYEVKAREFFDSTTQEPHWGSADPTSGPTTVDCCVIPALCQGDRVMAKARVLLKQNICYTAEEYDA